MVVKTFRNECHNCTKECDRYENCVDKVNPENMRNFRESLAWIEKKFEEINKK